MCHAAPLNAKQGKVSIYLQIGASDAYRYIGSSQQPEAPAVTKAKFLAANPHLQPAQVHAQL